MHDSNYDLMIMLATQQQIVNYKTYKHYNPKLVVALCTSYAEEQHWCYGFHALLGDRFIALPSIPNDMLDVRQLINAFKQRLSPLISKSSKKVIWAWGGAQKPHATALYLLSQEYIVKAHLMHEVIYAEGRSNTFIIDGKLDKITFNAKLSSDEVLKVHGLHVSKTDNTDSTQEELDGFLNNQSIREQEWREPSYKSEIKRLAADETTGANDVYKLATEPIPKTFLNDFYIMLKKTTIEANYDQEEMKTFLNSIEIAQHNKACISKVNVVLNKLKLRKKREFTYAEQPSGIRFEAHARRRMRNWYETRGHKFLSSMDFDVDVMGVNLQGNFGQSDTSSAGQFDCLMMTPQGRLIVIDFKSAGKTNNYRAQQTTARIAGGIFSDLYYLYPWIDEDLPTPANEKDLRPKNIQNRMKSIKPMDTILRPEGSPISRWRGIRFIKDTEEFYNDLERVLSLSC